MCVRVLGWGVTFPPQAQLHNQSHTLPALPVACLDSWSQECRRSCWWGEVSGNRKTWHSFLDGLGLESSEGLPFCLSPALQGEWGMVILP